MTPWHIVTGEYPPAPGGVSDYTQAIAAGLAAAGETVHVWCPAGGGVSTSPPGVHVHPVAGSWSRSDFDRIDAALAAMPGDKHLLVQWVPHAYGRRSLNLGFCRWMRRRARAGDTLDLMVHEPGLGFREGSLKHDAGAALHRLMLAVLLSRARRVWVAIPAWAEQLRPWTFGRSDMQFCWLPIPSTIPVAGLEPGSTDGADHDRRPGVILGHFSTYPPDVRRALGTLIPQLLAAIPTLRVQLLGRGGEEAAAELRAVAGIDGARVCASGELSAAALSRQLQHCDLLLQPYADGASTRRTTLMAALAHGLPVVTTVGRLSEAFWRDSGAIAAVPAGDLPAMARAVSELVHQPDRRRTLGSAARGTYEARFSLPRVIATLRSDTCGVS